jgi:WD40 repeat protein
VLQNNTIQIFNVKSKEVVHESSINPNVDYDYYLRISEAQWNGDELHILYAINPSVFHVDIYYKSYLYGNFNTLDNSYNEIEFDSNRLYYASFVPSTDKIAYGTSEHDINLFDVSLTKRVYEKEFEIAQCYHPVIINEQYITKVNKEDITVMNKESTGSIYEIENKFRFKRYSNYYPLTVSRTELIQFDYGKALALSIKNDGSYVWKAYYFNFFGI